VEETQTHRLSFVIIEKLTYSTTLLFCWVFPHDIIFLYGFVHVNNYQTSDHLNYWTVLKIHYSVIIILNMYPCMLELYQ